MDITVSKDLVSKVFAGTGIVFGLASIASIILGQPLPAIPLAILAVGSEYASALHA